MIMISESILSFEELMSDEEFENPCHGIAECPNKADWIIYWTCGCMDEICTSCKKYAEENYAINSIAKFCRNCNADLGKPAFTRIEKL